MGILASLGRSLSQMTIPMALFLNLGLFGYYYYNGYDDGSKLEVLIADTITKEDAEKIKKKETEKLLEEEESMKQEVGFLAEKFREVTAKLPIRLKVQEIIDTINQLAKNSGCRVVSVRPESIQSRELYDEIPVKIEMRGQFSNLVVFMYYLATLERVTHTGDISFVNEGPNYTGTLKFETVVISFRYKPPTEKGSEKTSSVPLIFKEQLSVASQERI